MVCLFVVLALSQVLGLIEFSHALGNFVVLS